MAKKWNEPLDKPATMQCAGCHKTVTTKNWKACTRCQAEVAPCCQGSYLVRGKCGNCRSGL